MSLCSDIFPLLEDISLCIKKKGTTNNSRNYFPIVIFFSISPQFFVEDEIWIRDEINLQVVLTDKFLMTPQRILRYSDESDS
jgi:hypothetical protein